MHLPAIYRPYKPASYLSGRPQDVHIHHSTYRRDRCQRRCSFCRGFAVSRRPQQPIIFRDAGSARLRTKRKIETNIAARLIIASFDRPLLASPRIVKVFAVPWGQMIGRPAAWVANEKSSGSGDRYAMPKGVGLPPHGTISIT